MELKAKPQTGLPLRTTSVITATTEVVISEKSKLELRNDDFSGIAVSRISVMRMGSGSCRRGQLRKPRMARASFAVASSAPRSSRMRTAFSQSAALLGVSLPLLR